MDVAKRRHVDPLSGTWPMTFANLVAVVALATVAHALARVFNGRPALDFTVFAVVAAVLVFALVAVPLRAMLLSERRVTGAREDLLAFETELHRALEMSDEEQSVLDVASSAMSRVVPEAELLLADSSHAHLQPVAVAGESFVGCSVGAPHRCVAIRQSQAMRFDDREALAVCPYLRARVDTPASAVCIPVNVMGRSTGVLHASFATAPVDEFVADKLEAVAVQTGTRLGLLRAMETSQREADTDPLTGLLNRRSLRSELRSRRIERGPYAIVMADLDRFKELNDHHGHDTGDRALRRFARSIRYALRAHDLAARHGGEEFVMVLPGLDAASAAAVVERVRFELGAALADGDLPPFTASFGVADSTHAETFDDLLGHADGLLLAAKRAGRDRVFVAGVDAVELDAIELNDVEQSSDDPVAAAVAVP